jgi:hypothetical protein
VTVPWRPDPNDPWPGRLYPWRGAPMHQDLEAAVRRDPAGAVTCVSAVMNGRNVRWCHRSVDLPCSAVQGGWLRFEGKILGDGELRSSLSLTDRVAEIASFSVGADNAQRLGFTLDGTTRGQYVRPLAGGTMEIAVCHPGVDWSKRRVVLRGTISRAKYGVDGETLSFTATPAWRALRSVALGVVDAERWPDAPDDSISKPYPLLVGYKDKHRAILVGLNGANGIYLVNGLPIGTAVSAAADADGLAVTLVNGGYVGEDALGEKVELFEAVSTDPELFVEARTNRNGFFRWTNSNGNPGSIGDLALYILARLTGISGEDLDLSGALGYRWLYLHAYGMSLDELADVKDVLEGRVVPQMFAYTSTRRGRYGVTPFPLLGPRGTPTLAAHFVYGRELLSGGVLSETDDADLRTSYAAEYRWDPLTGTYLSPDAKFGPALDPESSFWLRVSRFLTGESGGEILQFPDLWKWYDVRSVLRLDEYVRALVLRDTDYVATAEVLRAEAGDVVGISDHRYGWTAKPFLVTSVGATFRPTARLSLIEIPTPADFLGVYGSLRGSPSSSASN